MTDAYVGRFAPSPSGPLHAGSLVAAMASYLDARAHGGKWILRIEDVDKSRAVPGADKFIMSQLAALGMQWDDEVLYQSQRDAAYQAAFEQLTAKGATYGCACTRREIAEAAAQSNLGEADITRTASIATGDVERPYLGTCRAGLPAGRTPRAWRARMPDGVVKFTDRWMGAQRQDVAREVGDVVVRRADGLWAYQLAVVVDDAEQGVNHVVRGADLLTSTARQYLLSDLLGAVRPSVMHVPLVMDAASGLKLSKQNHAPSLRISRPLEALEAAFAALTFEPTGADTVAGFWERATALWACRFLLVQGARAA